MIRILHTGDWHIGQTLRGFSREREHDLVFDRIVRCNSLTVLATLAAAGLGITVLNEHYFQPEIAKGLLRVIRTTPELPPASYYASFRSDALDPLAHNVALLARDCCDFSIRRSAMV